jgi:hypothetical protein
MNRLHRLPLVLAVMAMTLLTACGGGGGTVVDSAYAEPADFSLTPGHHEVLRLTVPEDGKYNLDVEVTYFSEQMQGMDALPMSCLLTAGGVTREEKFSIPVRKDGQWLGTLVKEGGMDYLVKQTVITGIDLKQSDAEFHLRAETPAEQPILGMVKLEVKLVK